MRLNKIFLSIVFFLWFFQFSCIATEVVYVSSTLGDDSYNGLSEATPFKTIKKALRVSCDIRLKAGDTFFENIELNQKYISRYGQGPNPVICGYKRIITPKWEKVDSNIWRISLKEGNYSGFIVEGSSLSNNIGCIHEYDKDLIHGRKVQYKTELKENWDIWQTERFDKQLPHSEFDWLYLYYSDDPNELNIEFSVSNTAISVITSTIDCIDIKGFGFGLSCWSGTKVRNCSIDAIGGIIQIGAPRYTCYGNGIEFYVNRNISNCIVENCTISRCYDCGVTIQASDCGKATPSNIIIRNNLIYNCCQGWEDFLRNDDNVVYENCIFENNILLNNGNTSGFGYPESRFKYCHILGNNSSGNKGMIIRNNIFVGGNYFCGGSYNGEYKSNIWEGNKCYIKRGDYIIGGYFGKEDVIRIPIDRGSFQSILEATKESVKRYRELTGDMTTQFVVKSEKWINRKAKKLRKSNKQQKKV